MIKTLLPLRYILEISELSYSQKQRKKLDTFLQFFTEPDIHPLELFLVGVIYEKFHSGGIKISQNELELLITNWMDISIDTSYKFGKEPKTASYYIKALTRHHFLKYDTSTDTYTTTKISVNLGQILIKLQEPEFSYYDTDYLQKIVIEVKDIFENWRNKLKNYSKKEFKETNELIQLTDQMLKYEQQLSNINQLEIQIIDLGQQSIDLIEELNIILGNLQRDLIEGINNDLEFMIIYDMISEKIEKFDKKIDRLNLKSKDIQELIQNNEKNIEIIDNHAEAVILLINTHFQEDEYSNEEVKRNLSRIYRQCEKIIEFSNQLNLTTFEVILKKSNTVQLLFIYLQNLINDNQLIGDLYNVWKFGIREIIQSDKAKVSIETLNQRIMLGKYVKDTSFDEISTFQKSFKTEREIEKQIIQRNVEYRRIYENQSIVNEEIIAKQKRDKQLVSEIKEKIEEKAKNIHFYKMIYEHLMENELLDSKNFLNLVSKIIVILSEEWKIIRNGNYTINEFLFPEGKYVIEEAKYNLGR